MQSKQQHLLSLVFAKENQEFQQIKKRFSEQPKYFFNVRRNITIVYDKPMLYIIHKQYLKIVELKKAYTITDLAYNYKKNAVLYFTAEGELHVYFVSTKSRYQIKKDFKKVFILQWLYSAHEHVSLFVASEDGIHLYRVYQQQKRSIKQIKHISGRYICYLYEPRIQFLVGFEYGECQNPYLYHFQPQKAKNWFKNGQISIRFSKDQSMAHKIKSTKRLGLQGNRISKQLFNKKSVNEENFIDIQALHGIPYLIFYFANEGKLQLTPLVESHERKQLTIKLPSDSPPNISVYDNMLVVHLKAERITFIYEINSNNFQPLVSPYPLSHQNKQLIFQLYENQFISTRALLPNGHISKWKITVPVIYSYLKVDIHIFEFLNRRTNCKIEAIKWMRENLFRFKPVDLSRMWKSVFSKIGSQTFDQNQIISMIEIYTNLFYTLSIEPKTDQLQLANILMECLRQANEFRIIIPQQLQSLAVKLLLNTQQIQLLIYLIHHGILENQEKSYELIFERGKQENSDVLFALAIDMASQCALPKDLLKLIMISQRPKQAKRYIRMNFSRLEPQYMLECAKYLKDQSKIKEYRQFLNIFFARKRLDVSSSQIDRRQPE